MKLLHITNPRTYLIPSFRDFALKALASDPFIFSFDAYIELAQSTRNTNIGLFVTVDDNDEFVGLVLVANSTTALAPGCIVLHFYNQGADAESRKLLIRALVEFAKAHGCSKIRGTDVNHKPEAFARLFRDVGRPSEAGQTFEFDIEGPDSE